LQERVEIMKETVKQILIRSIGLTLATAAGGTAIGAFAGDWVMGTIIGIGSAFAVAITILGVSLTWNGRLTSGDVQNAFRAAVAKTDSEAVKDALEVVEDGDFDWDDIEDNDPDLAR
jgi:hypothetical protein